jgi:hypothetical protein
MGRRVVIGSWTVQKNSPLIRLTHVGTAYFQFLLSITFCVGYFWVLREFMSGQVKVPTEFKDVFIALLGIITANLGNILQFWFARQRVSADPTQNPPAGSSIVEKESTVQSRVIPSTDAPPLSPEKPS